MPLNLSDQSLDWALAHARNELDTDIFPKVFEFEAIAESWDDVKAYIKNSDASAWKIRASRRCLVPKHKFGFRISTQLDPLDFLVFTALVREVGDKLEKIRVPLGEGIVHSYRFDPKRSGRMFSDAATYRTFQRASHKQCSTGKTKFVVVADIADFFPRLYTHRVDNALDTALKQGHMHGTAIKNLIGQWAGAYSYGIPVGSAAARLIAEVAIADIDQALLSEGLRYVRYCDDFRFFCTSESEAYRCLTLVARFLLENHGLTLQQHKTKILSVKKFKSYYLRENEKREVDTLAERFAGLLESLGIEDPYVDIDIDNLSPRDRAKIEELNLTGILLEQIKLPDPDISLIKFLLRRLSQLGSSDAVDVVTQGIEKFVPVIREAVEYLLQVPSLTKARKATLGKRLLASYSNPRCAASQLEYSRMYLLHPFSQGNDWNNDAEYIKNFGGATDEFSQRELILALGKSQKAFWFRGRKQSLMAMVPWVRRAFIFGASCLPQDEYRHWVRGVQQQLDPLEKSVSRYGIKSPI